jgi:hypothetical protein
MICPTGGESGVPPMTLVLKAAPVMTRVSKPGPKMKSFFGRPPVSAPPSTKSGRTTGKPVARVWEKLPSVLSACSSAVPVLST